MTTLQVLLQVACIPVLTPAASAHRVPPSCSSMRSVLTEPCSLPAAASACILVRNTCTRGNLSQLRMLVI